MDFYVTYSTDLLKIRPVPRIHCMTHLRKQDKTIHNEAACALVQTKKEFLKICYYFSRNIFIYQRFCALFKNN